MTQYKPFIEDPEHLARLEGQRFVVLRAVGAVAEAFRPIQNALRDHLRGKPISYPAQPHVTLAGFSAGTEITAVHDLVTHWAQSVPPLQLAVERVSAFPAPFQVLIVEIRRTPALYQALVTLRQEGHRRNLDSVGLTPPEQWTFHMSLAYCDQLPTPDSWDRARRFGEELELNRDAQCVVESAEIVAFDAGHEYSAGLVALAGA
jgi:2'-5' RNA ligase